MISLESELDETISGLPHNRSLLHSSWEAFVAVGDCELPSVVQWREETGKILGDIGDVLTKRAAEKGRESAASRLNWQRSAADILLAVVHGARLKSAGDPCSQPNALQLNFTTNTITVAS